MSSMGKIDGFAMSLLAIPARISYFIEKHPFWSFLIFILILSYFAPVPYLHDFVRGITEFIWESLGIGVKKVP